MKKLLLLALSAVAFGAFSLSAEADVIAHYDFSGNLIGTSQSGLYVKLGNGLSGVPYSVTEYLASHTGSSGVANGAVGLLCFTDSAYTHEDCAEGDMNFSNAVGGGQLASSSPGTYNGTPQEVTWFLYNIPNGYSMNPAHYYMLQNFILDLGITDIYGSSTASPANCAYAYCTGSAYFKLSNSILSSTNTRVVSQDYPADTTKISELTPVFKWHIYYNDSQQTYDKTGVQVQDLTALQTLNTPDQNITASGGSDYSLPVPLSPLHAYAWRAYISDSTGAHSTIYAPVAYSFSEGVAPPFNENNATSTAGGAIGNFLNLPAQVATHYPFSYFVDTVVLLKSESTMTGTSTFPSLTWDLGLGATSTPFNGHPITVFATSTVIKYVNSPTQTAIRVLVGAVLWIIGLMTIFWEVKSFWR